MSRFSSNVREAVRQYMEKFQAALIPVKFREKKPTVQEWQNLRIQADEIEQYFPLQQTNIGAIWGSASNGLMDVDHDCYEARILSDNCLPPTSLIYGRSSAPRSHKIYKVTGCSEYKSVRFKFDPFGTLVELRGDGCQSVIPPSVHTSGELIRFDCDADPATISYADLFKHVSMLAAASLTTRLWPQEGGRNDFALALAGALLQAGMEDEVAEHFIRMVSECAGDEESESRAGCVAATRGKIDDGEAVTGFNQVADTIGKKAAKKIFYWLGLKHKSNGLVSLLPEEKKVLEAQILELNKTYAFVLVGGQPVVMRHNPISFESMPRIEFISVKAFCELYRNQYVTINGKLHSLGEVWMGHPLRLTYNGFIFDLISTPPGFYNSFKGFSITPKKGSCEKFLAHIRDNICKKNLEHYKWIMTWWASLYQHPERRPGTSIVLRGKQGTGKSLAINYLSAGFKDYFVVAPAPRYVTGRFNSHMFGTIILYADEGFWAGDKEAESKIKNYITDDVLMIEFKGKEPIRMRNYMRLVTTTNSDWAVPAGFEERRFAVFDVGNDSIQDQAYFKAIVEEMENGGAEALLDYLLNYDTSVADIRVIPLTSALLEQKIASMNDVQLWWLDVLQRGSLPCSVSGMRGDYWQGICPIEDLVNNYIVHCGKVNFRRRSSETQLGIGLRKLVPKLKRTTLKVTRGDDSSYNAPAYEFPILKVCRQEFEKLVGQFIDWEDGGKDDDGAL